MRTKPDAQPTSVTSPLDNNVSLLLTMADTTWRMIIPSAVFVLAGIFADLKLSTKPWLTLLGVVLGLGSSAILIKRQIGAVR